MNLILCEIYQINPIHKNSCCLFYFKLSFENISNFVSKIAYDIPLKVYDLKEKRRKNALVKANSRAKQAEAERQARAKSERQKSDLVRELEELTDRLDEASGATAAQMELNKKREIEVGRMRKDLEEASIQQEATMLSLRKKHQDAIGEMSEQIEQLNKLKVK